MQRTLQLLGCFWPAIMLVALILGTMIEPLRHHIEEVSIQGHLTQWTIALVPGFILVWLSEKMAQA